MNTESISPLSQGVYNKYALLEMQNLIPAQSLQGPVLVSTAAMAWRTIASVTIHCCETLLKPIVLQSLSQ